MASLGFKVDGGFITDIAREWFWKENRPFESVRELLMSCMITDDMKSWEGLIDPKGNFYSCEFGAHNAKAYNIIKNNPSRFGIKKDKIYDFSIMDGSLDILIDHGWVATRYLQTKGFYYSRSVRKMTKSQEDKLFDAIVKFGLNPNSVSEELYK